MNHCSQCSSPIPEGQSICSMCMGDINHGSDGYYERWALEQESKTEQEKRDEQEYYGLFDVLKNPDNEELPF